MISAKSWFKGLSLVFAVVVISLGTIGGCSDGGGGGGDNVTTRDPIHGVFLCEHRPEAVEDLMDAMDLGDHNGNNNHIHIDGMFIHECTEQEQALMREAFNEEFIISVYEATDEDIKFLKNQILQLQNLHEEIENLDEVPIGDFSQVFTIEQHDGLIWTSMSHHGATPPMILSPFGTTNAVEATTVMRNELAGAPPFGLHALHKREWIEGYGERRLELIEDGLLNGNVEEVMNNFGLMEEFEASRDATQGGSVLSLATAWIQTNQLRVGFNSLNSIVGVGSASEVNTYQLVTKAWVATESTPNGTFSFLCVNQDLDLASANGFNTNSDTQQAWYLSEYKNINTIQISGTTLDVSKAQLIDNKPDTNQETTSSTTTSVSTSLSGTVGVDQTSGANASISGGISWSTSNTFSKANVSIDNLSLSATTTGNDASWRYNPRKASILDDSCDNSIHDLADLSHNTFSPSQAWIMRIDGSEVDKTLTLKTVVSMILTNTYVGDCNIFGCACKAKNQNAVPSQGQGTFTQSIHIPAAPQ